MQKITPFLWFAGQAEEAANYYVSIFKNAQQCGWLKDKYGLSWQIVPRVLGELLSGPDPGKAGRVMKAMPPMKKIDLAAILRAAAG
ncbi:MAG: VOC family protein [Candidatus Methylomirabilia bacterium]